MIIKQKISSSALELSLIHILNTNQGLNIDQTKAKEIALGQVNSGVIGEFSLDYERGIPVYEITVYEGRTEYEFEISGIDGSIISRSVDTNLD